MNNAEAIADLKEEVRGGRSEVAICTKFEAGKSGDGGGQNEQRVPEAHPGRGPLVSSESWRGDSMRHGTRPGCPAATGQC